MATSLTRNLKLRINSNLTADAKYNLERLDLLGSTFLVDSTDQLNIRSISDILIEPQSADLGASGTGGTVSIGSASHELDNISLYTAEFTLSTTLGLADQASGGNKDLKIQYKSDLNGSVDTTVDRTLSIDLDGADRSLVLGGALSLLGGDLTLNLSGTTSVTLPQTGVLSTLAGNETLSSKNIDAGSNNLTNITNSSISNSAGIVYSKLNLASSIVNADISSSASIVYSKLSIINSVVDADINSAAAIARSKIASGSINHVVINDSAGNLSSEAALATSRGGTGVSGTAVFPGSGTIATADNVLTFTNKTISGASNTLTGIQYASLSLSGSIVNSDINSAAAIAYSKLALSGSIVNADVSPSAAIAYPKLNLLNSLFNSDINSAAAIAYSKLDLAGSIVNADVSAIAAIAGTKISPDFGNQVIKTLDRIRFEEGGYTTDLRAAQSGQSSNLDFRLPPDHGTLGQVLVTNGSGEMSWVTSGGTGTVTSVALTADPIISVNGSPITTAGTIDLQFADQVANTVFSGPTTGADDTPTFRLLVKADLPALTTDDIPEGSNLYFTDERAQDAVGTILVDSSKIDFTYTDATPSITATIVAGSLTNADINASAAIALSKLAALTADMALQSDGSGVISASAVTATELGYVSGVTSAIQTQLNNKQPLDSTLTALAAYNTNGFLVQTAADTFAGRTLTAGAGISITNGDGVAGNPSIASTITQYTDELAQDAVGGILLDSSNIDFTYDDSAPSITADLTDTAVTPGTYGSASSVSVIDVDQKGRLTAAASTAISITSGAVTDFNEAAQDAVGGILTDSATIDFTYNDATPSITAIVVADSLTNTQINSAAAIAYSKLNLTGSIVNADINAAAAIAYSKLSLTGSIVNADINASAAIALTKLAALTNHNRALVSDSSGFITESATTDTEIGYVSGVTSAIQTQLNNKQPLDSDLTALAGLSTTGLIVRTGAGTAATRTLVAGTGISITNSDGVAGNITINSTATVSSFKSTWATADGTSKVITHNLGTTDVIIQLFNNTDSATIEIDSVVRTDANTATLTATQAPASSWRVLILAV